MASTSKDGGTADACGDGRGDPCVFQTYEFSLLIVRNSFRESEHYGKWLAVNEVNGQGWWIPAGAVDFGETFEQAAHRECLEEAGIKVKLRGVLRVEHSVTDGDQCRQRIVYYAEPESLAEANNLKKTPDSESMEARWVTLDELLNDLDKKPPFLRGYELVDWITYLENGGHVYPLSMIGMEYIRPSHENSRSFSILEE